MLGLGKEELEELSKEDRVVFKYMKELERVNENPEFREYMSREEDERKIYNSRIAYAEKIGMERGIEKGIKKGIEKGIEKGIKKGIEKGIEEGEAKQKIEIAINLIKKNIDIDIISEVTNLPKEEIMNLKA